MWRPPAVLLALVLALAPRAAAQDDEEAARRPPTRAEARVIARILELQGEIDELLASLPPHLRDEVRERLIQLQAPVETPPPAAEPAPEAAAEPAPEAATGAAPQAASSAPGAGGSRSGPPPLVAPSLPAKIEPTSCNTLWLFDTDRSGNVDGADRYWRHLYLWRDKNGDGLLQDEEVLSAYEHGVRQIAVALDSFRRKNESVGEIEIDRYVILDVQGNGFDGITGNGDDGALVVDASRLQRGVGPQLLSPEGEELEGFQPFRHGLRLRQDSGEELLLSCP